MSFVWIFLWLTASCKKGQRKRTKKEKCWTAIKGGKLGEEVCSIRGNSITGMFCTSLYIWKLQIGKLRLVRLKLCENLLPWNIIVTQHGKRLVLLGVTCIFFFLILKFLNRLKCFWLSIQVTNRLYCFNVCNFCHPRTIFKLFVIFLEGWNYQGSTALNFDFIDLSCILVLKGTISKLWVDKIQYSVICMKLSTWPSASFLCVCSLERNAGKVYCLSHPYLRTPELTHHKALIFFVTVSL